MPLTRAIACCLLAAQMLWAFPSTVIELASCEAWSAAGVDSAEHQVPADNPVRDDDHGPRETPADPLLEENEEESKEDRLKHVDLESVSRLVGVTCVDRWARFHGRPDDRAAQTPDRVILDLDISRAPPALAERTV